MAEVATKIPNRDTIELHQKNSPVARKSISLNTKISFPQVYEIEEYKYNSFKSQLSLPQVQSQLKIRVLKFRIIPLAKSDDEFNRNIEFIPAE